MKTALPVKVTLRRKLAERDREYRPSYLPKDVPCVPKLWTDAEGLQAKIDDPIHGLGLRGTSIIIPKFRGEHRRKRESQRQEGS